MFRRSKKFSLFRALWLLPWRTIRVVWRTLRIGWWAAVTAVLVSIVAVISFTWLTPPTSGIQLQRQIEAKFDSKTDWNPQHQWVEWQAISPSVALAVIGAEDQRFLDHNGFDAVQIQKALAASQQGKTLRGASTITQQTAKNIFLWNGRSFVRKGLEAWFSVLMELCWSKQRILEMYLNSIEFGPGIFGVEAAGQHYFGKTAKDLNRYEAALLAAVLPNPHRLHVDNPSAYVRKRQVWIVNQMRQLGGEQIILAL